MTDPNENRMYELIERIALLEQIARSQHERDLDIELRLKETVKDFTSRIDLHEQRDLARYTTLSDKLDTLVKARTREAGFLGGILFVGSLLGTLIALSGLKILDFLK